MYTLHYQRRYIIVLKGVYMKTAPIKTSFNSLLNAAKPTVRKAAKHVKENPGVYATAGVGAYVGGKLLHDLAEDTAEFKGATDTIIPDTAGEGIGRPLGYKIKTEWTNEPTLFQKIQAKIHNTVELSDNAPDWLDNTKPYMVTKSGKLVTDEYGVLINPWFKGTPEEIIQNAASTPGFVKPTMSEFLGKGIMEPVSGGFAPDFQGGVVSVSDLGLDDVSENIIGIVREAIDSLS